MKRYILTSCVLFILMIFISGCSNESSSNDELSIIPQLINNNEQEPALELHISIDADWQWFQDFDKLSEEADIIIRGKIIESQNQSLILAEGMRAIPHTVFTLMVSDIFKGDIQLGEHVYIKQLGGICDDGLIATAGGIIPFQIGREYVVFLNQWFINDNVISDQLNPFQTAYVFDVNSRAMDDVLENQHPNNPFVITYYDLENVRETFR